MIVVIQILTFGMLIVSAESPIWQDEFSEPSIDRSKWEIITGDGCPDLCGFGNNELQYYTDSQKNLRIEDGVLILEVHKEKKGSQKYSSAKLITKEKGDWKYGRVVVRAKLPSGRGTWPAIWMLPTVSGKSINWPLDGEIDIMEHVGYDQDIIHGTIHTAAYNGMKGNQKSGKIEIEDSSQEFHDYTIVWDETRIQWFVDDTKYFEFAKESNKKEEWPFDEPFHLILNVAVGGSWGGSKGIDDSIWPQRMEIDYVRIYEK